jgi:2-methylcitrate dehydratase PrpD
VSGLARQSLSQELAQLLNRPVTTEDRVRAQQHVLDWFGCVLAGGATPEGVALRKWADSVGQAGECPTVHGQRAHRETALYVNGGVGNVLEMDDLHRTAILHPGPVVIPAALVAAQAVGASGEQLLDAIVRGYEAMIRVGRSFGTGHYRFWHNTGTAGPFGAAAAVADLMGADAMTVAYALGHAGTQSSGLWQTRHEPSMSKQLHTGHAAHSGLIAAEFAVGGMPAPFEILEGEQGFYAAMCTDPIPELVVSESYAPWLIWDVSFKPWPACRHAHATIDAALELAGAVGADRIESIEVRTYDEAVRFCDQPNPASVLQAKFSLQHAVAVCLVRGAPSLADFEASGYEDPTLQAFAQRVTVQSDPQISGRFPHRYGASVVATLTDGTECQFDSPDALGDPDKPVGDDRIKEKYNELLAYAGVTPEVAQPLYSVVQQLHRASSLAPLLEAFTAAGRSAVNEVGDE